MRRLACLVLLASACAEQPHVHSSEEPALPDGGYVELRWISDGETTKATALAELYAGIDGPGELPVTWYEDFPAGHCFQVPTDSGEATFYSFRDVGPSIEVGSLSLARESIFSNLFYRATPESLPLGETLDVSMPGLSRSFSRSLRLPPVPLSPQLDTGVTFANGESLEVVFEPTGAEWVFLLFWADGGGRICRVEDDGAFTVPASTLAMLPAEGSFVISAVDVAKVDLDGRTLHLVGRTERVAGYRRTP